MWTELILIFLSLLVFFVILFGIAHLIALSSKLPIQLINYKARVSESPFTKEEIDIALQKLDEEWTKLDPKKSKQVKKLLNKISIEWRPRRWIATREVNGQIKQFRVNAEQLSKYKIAVWIGPKLLRENRKLRNSALILALIKAILFTVYKAKDPDVRPYMKLIRSLNKTI